MSDGGELPIAGYLDRLSAFPGESIDGFVSISCNDLRYDITLQRVICADPNPSGPGLCFENIGSSSSCIGSRQRIQIGSHAILPINTASPSTTRTWCLLFHVGVPVCDRTTLFSDEGGSANDTFTVSLDGNGIHFDHGIEHECSLSHSVRPNEWHRLLVAVNLKVKTVRMGIGALGRETFYVDHRYQGGASQFSASSKLMLAARGIDWPRNHFTGKLEAPLVMDDFLEAWPDRLADSSPDLLIGGWDFAIGIGGNEIFDSGPNKLHGQLHNQPTRGVKGSRWNGKEHCWRNAPDHYAAIHFHDDDLADCKWEKSFSFQIPLDVKSGSYALELRAGDAVDWLPFFVRPRPQDKKASLLFLAPTFTYQAYANGRLSNLFPSCRKRNREWSGTIYASELYPMYGCSTYDTHKDGSGVSFSSRKRPMLTMRPGFVSLYDSHGSGVRHYPADSHLTAWLEAKDIPFDVVTDEDLHIEGVSALRDYPNVITGTHPEYHTRQTLDALEEYFGTGGKLAYMGGNGFYWKIAHGPGSPHLMEIRRAEGGIRTWAAEAGEYYNAIDGELGGLWSRNGRPPHRLVGIGFSSQGPFAGGPYKRSPASYDPDLAWVFEGVESAVFGDYGLSGGGAAGFELDRAEPKFGSPGSTTVLATSCSVPPGYVPCYEELLTDEMTVTGVHPKELIRADIALSKTDGGGMVFAVGSITFCGSLWKHNAFEGPVSRILENVLERWNCIPKKGHSLA